MANTNVRPSGSIKLPTPEQRLSLREAPAHREPVMYQTWHDLLFLHWRWDPVEIQKTLPEGLYVDLFNSQAFIGVTPFFMKDVRPVGLPAVPMISDFLELNVRTYVIDSYGRPGVWFYSLDCNQWLAVKAAKTFFHLPYVYSTMEAETEQQGDTLQVDYKVNRDGKSSTFRYRRMAPLGEAAPGSLEFFLVERYLLFSWNETEQQLYSGRVHHVPYPLSEAIVSNYDQTMLELNGFSGPSREPDHIIASAGVRVKVYGLERVE